MAQLGKSIPDTQMGMDVLKQASEKVMSDIEEKYGYDLQEELRKEFPTRTEN